MIQYRINMKNVNVSISRIGISYIKIDKNNYKLYSDLIKNSIQLFNSEIEWDEMWNYEDSIKRFENGHTIYLMIKNNNVIGYIWYDKNFLYNLFVSKTRIKGESRDFVNHTLNNVIPQHPTIECECDDWNVRAQKFFKGLGFTEKKEENEE